MNFDVTHALFAIRSLSGACGGRSTVSIWRIAAKLICHAALSPFPSFSSGSLQGRVVLDIILATGEDLGAMATMVVQATILGMEGAVRITMEIMVVQATIQGMEGGVQITTAIMVAQAITLADLTTMATMEDQATTLEAEVVLATMATMEDQDTTLVTMATMAVADQITTATTVGPAITPADRVTMATTGTVAVGTTLGAAQVSMGDQGGTQGPRSTGKWSVPLSEVGSTFWIQFYFCLSFSCRSGGDSSSGRWWGVCRKTTIQRSAAVRSLMNRNKIHRRHILARNLSLRTATLYQFTFSWNLAFGPCIHSFFCLSPFKTCIRDF